MKNYEILEHTADFCIKVKADTLQGLFAAAAEGLMNNIFNEIKYEKDIEKAVLSVEGESPEDVLVKFLNELLYIFYIKKLLPKNAFCFINLDKNKLVAEADFVKIKEFSANFEVKAITYGNIKIECDNNLYETTVIADV